MTRALVLVSAVLLGAALLGAPAGLARAADPAADVTLVDYVVQPGDSCAAIAKKLFGSGRKYTLLHKYNDLGPLPHKLKAGQILKVPAAEAPASPDAKVTRTAGDVRARAPSAATEWTPAPPGTSLWRAWRVGSEARSQAEVTFRDTSIVYVREHTVVVIYGPSAARAREQVGEAVLEKGSLRTRLGELSGDKTLTVQTPSSEARLGAGGAVVGAYDDGVTAVSNHSGKPAKVRGKDKAGKAKGKPVAVGAGMGSTVAKGAAPTPPRPLPTAPPWDDTQPSIFVSADGATGGLAFAWAAAPEAAAYRVVLARDPAGADVVETVVVEGGVTRFEASGLPLGEYHALVAVVGQDRLEGAPGPARGLRVVAVEARPPADLGEALAPGTAWLGTKLVAPEGLSCTPAILATTGRTEVVCRDAAGRAAPPFVVDVRAPVIGITPPDRGFRAGEESIFFIVGPPALLATLQVTVNGVAATLSPTPDGRVDARVALPASAAGDAVIESFLVVDGTRVPLVRRTFGITAGAEAAPSGSAGASAAPRWQLGLWAALGGASAIDDRGPDPEDVEASGSAAAGLRVGRRLAGPLAGELELAAGSLFFAEGASRHSDPRVTASLGLRVELGGGSLHPFLAAGAGLALLPDDGATTYPIVHAGAGALFHVAARAGLRLELRGVLELEADDPRVPVEAQLGAFLDF